MCAGNKYVYVCNCSFWLNAKKMESSSVNVLQNAGSRCSLEIFFSISLWLYKRSMMDGGDGKWLNRKGLRGCCRNLWEALLSNKHSTTQQSQQTCAWALETFHNLTLTLSLSLYCYLYDVSLLFFLSLLHLTFSSIEFFFVLFSYNAKDSLRISR